MPSRFRYSRWDGTQKGFEVDADDVLGEVTDDLLYHGDLDASLRRLMQQGFTDRDGEQVQGIRDLIERLREARRERLEQHDLGGAYEDIAERLRDVIAKDAEAIDAFEQEARDSGDARRQELTEEVSQQRRDELAGLPPDLAGQVRALQEHDFTSDEARDEFDALMDELRKEMVQSWFSGMSEAMADPDPEQMARVKDMLAELNEMLSQRAAGQEPDFEGFMEPLRRHVPGEPARPRRAARGHGPPHGGHAVDARLDDPRAAGPAPVAVGRADGGPGPALADGPAGRQPAAAVPRRRLGPPLRVRGHRPARASPRPPG